MTCGRLPRLSPQQIRRVLNVVYAAQALRENYWLCACEAVEPKTCVGCEMRQALTDLDVIEKVT